MPNETNTGFVSKIEKIDLNKYINTDAFDEDDRQLLNHLRKLLPSEISKYINRNSPFGGVWEHIVQQQDEELPEETRQLIAEYLHPKLKKIFEEQHNSNFIFQLPEAKQFTTANIESIHLGQDVITPYFIINQTENNFTVECRVKLPLLDLNVNENENISPHIYQSHETIFLWERSEDISTIEKFLPTGFINIAKENWNNELQNFILPLSKDYDVDLEILSVMK